MPIWTGYNVPFLTDSSVLSIQHDARLIKNDLMQLLLTSPGERVMKPELGTPIRTLTFESVNESDTDSIRTSIATAVARYEPRVTIVDILIDIDDDEALLTITIYGIVNLDSSDKFVISIGVSSGGIKFVRAR